jgi:hypothetical protein
MGGEIAVIIGIVRPAVVNQGDVNLLFLRFIVSSEGGKGLLPVVFRVRSNSNAQDGRKRSGVVDDASKVGECALGDGVARTASEPAQTRMANVVSLGTFKNWSPTSSFFFFFFQPGKLGLPTMEPRVCKGEEKRKKGI